MVDLYNNTTTAVNLKKVCSALYIMYNYDDKRPDRPGLEPGTSSLDATTETDEPLS